MVSPKYLFVSVYLCKLLTGMREEQQSSMARLRRRGAAPSFATTRAVTILPCGSQQSGRRRSGRRAARRWRDVDLIGGLVRLLTLTDETQVKEAERNSRGIFPVAALPTRARTGQSGTAR